MNQQSTEVQSKSISWLRLARIGWYLWAAVALVIFTASIPGYFLFAPRGFTESQQFTFNPAPIVLSLNIIAGLVSISITILSFCLAIVLFRHQPEDRMAQILSFFLLTYAIVTGPVEFLQPLLSEFAKQSLLVLTLLISLPQFFSLFALFPDGRFVPRWTRWLVLASFFLVPIALFTFPDYSAYFSNTPPLMLRVAGQILIFTFFSGVLYAQIYRYRSVSASHQRQQTKWVVYGFGIMLALLAISSVPWTRLTSLPQGTPFPLWGSIASLIYALSFVSIPVTLTMAVIRFRLYDIDIIINHSLVYGVLTVGVVGLYILLVSLTGLALQTHSALASALLTTLLVAMFIRPLQAGLQSKVDRLVNRQTRTPLDKEADRSPEKPQQNEEISAAPLNQVARHPSRFWLGFTRAAWYPIAVLALGILVISIPGFFNIGTGEISDPRFSPNPSPWISLITWVTALGALATALISLFLAALLYQRSAADRMALLTSFFLLAYSVVVAGPVEALEPFFHGVSGFTQNVLIPGFIPFFMLLFAIFPDGRFVPRWIRWVVLTAFPTILFSLYWTSLYTKSPLDLHEPVVLISIGLALVLAVFFWFSLLYAQIYRYRNISTLEQKQQTKWVVFGIGVWLTFQMVSAIPWTYSFSLPQGTPLPLWLSATSILWVVSIAMIPITLAFAVLRYRLFEIDFLINRSLVYGGLTAAVIMIYILMVGALGMFFQAQGNLVIALLATGLVAVLFQPLRERLQRAVNRLIYGERDDPVEALYRLGKRLESAIDPHEVLPTIVATIAQTLKLPYVAIHLPSESGDRVAAAHGLPSMQAVNFPLIYQGQTIGQLEVAPHHPDESFTSSEMRLLQNIARQAGAAVHAVRLTADLQRSRQGLVTAREEERRRLRRDLHDGIGPTMAGQTLKLDAAVDLILGDPENGQEPDLDEAVKLLREVKEQTQETVKNIRQIVYALRPPSLDDLGLVAAIQAYLGQLSVSRHRLDISLETSPRDLPHLPAAVEVAAYRIVLEALTNVVRHAQAQECMVKLSVPEMVDKTLYIEVKDDGIGFLNGKSHGVGLTSIRERVEELGGSVTIESSKLEGTRLLAQIPLFLQET